MRRVRGPLVLLLLIVATMLAACNGKEKAPEEKPKEPPKEAPPTKGAPPGNTDPNAGKSGLDTLTLYTPEGTEGFFQDLLVFFGAERPPSRALAKIRDTHNLRDWTYRIEVPDAVETTREAVLELTESDYDSWEETALVIAVLSTMATRDASSLVRADCITSLTWFRGWIHDDAVRMGRGVATTEEDVIKALRALDKLKTDPKAGTDPFRTLLILDSVSVLGSHPWDELASERPSVIRTTLSRPRGVSTLR